MTQTWRTAARSSITGRTVTPTARTWGCADAAPHGPVKQFDVTPLFRFSLCPPNQSNADDPCYILTMLRHDGAHPNIPQARSWWLVRFTRKNDMGNAPPWSNAAHTGRRGAGDPGVNAPSG